MKKALFALGLLAVALLPGCLDNGSSGSGRTEVQVKSYGKGVHTQAMDEHEKPGDDIHFEMDEEDEAEYF